MAKQIPKHYFEPSAILAWLKRETTDGEERWWHCWQILEEANRGESIIYTSGLTLAEVTGGIRAFFENEYVEIVEAGRVVGELARQLIWDFPTLNSFDATHLASALDANCDVLYTYDKDLLKIADASGRLTLGENTEVGRLAAWGSLRILRPKWEKAMQTPLLGLGGEPKSVR